MLGYAILQADEETTGRKWTKKDAIFSRSRLREYVSSRIRNPAGLTLESPPDHGSGSAHHGKS